MIYGLNGDQKQEKITATNTPDEGNIELVGLQTGIRLIWFRESEDKQPTIKLEEKDAEGNWAPISLAQSITIKLTTDNLIPEVTILKYVV